MSSAGAAIAAEERRQEDHVELIASENYASPRVLEAQGTVLTNKYAEGYPGKRYYGGCEYVDIAEQLAIDRAKALFGADYANVQPHSGSQANAAAYLAMMAPGDTLLGMSLPHGGHLTHGAKVNFSGSIFNAVQYGLDEASGEVDYDAVARLARELISAGGPDMVPTTLLRQADDLADRAEKLLATSTPLFSHESLEERASTPATPEEVQQKIEAIYGAQPTEEGVLFVAHAPGASHVQLAGDFNDWQPETTPMQNGTDGESFRTLLSLAPGRYRYRYVIDGQWRSDPHNDYVESNPFGELNSVVDVA